MNKRKNISNDKSWKSALLWSVTTLSILVVLWLSVQRKANSDVQHVSIEIMDLKGKRNLINRKYVLSKCQRHLGYDIRSSKIKELDMRMLEQMLNADKRVKNAEVYIDNRHVVHIKIVQRQPIVRVQGDETAYYLGIDGEYIPRVKGSAVRVPIVTGYVGDYEAVKLTSKKGNALQDVYTIAKYIHEDDFLQSLVEQINVDRNRQIILVPKIGKQELVFGKAEEIEERFYNLKQFYKKGMSKVGWRKFDRLVLNWEGQVVGQKAKHRN